MRDEVLRKGLRPKSEDPVESGREDRTSPLMLWHIGRPIGQRIPINKGYSKEITIIYTP